MLCGTAKKQKSNIKKNELSLLIYRLQGVGIEPNNNMPMRIWSSRNHHTLMVVVN